MVMVSLKLKNGSDIVGVLKEKHDKYILVENPISIIIGPEYGGFFAKSYLMFAEGTVARFDNSDLMLFARANQKAIQYYKDFHDRLYGIEEESQAIAAEFDPDDSKGIGEMEFVIHESRKATKH